jgi:hypothetical protein
LLATRMILSHINGMYTSAELYHKMTRSLTPTLSMAGAFLR